MTPATAAMMTTAKVLRPPLPALAGAGVACRAEKTATILWAAVVWHTTETFVTTEVSISHLLLVLSQLAHTGLQNPSGQLALRANDRETAVRRVPVTGAPPV